MFKKVVLFITMCVLVASTGIGCIGDPANPLDVQNNHNNSIKFTVNGEEWGTIPAQAKQGFVGLPVDPDESEAQKKYILKATDSQTGAIVYSKEFTWQELHDMKWTIVISP